MSWALRVLRDWGEENNRHCEPSRKQRSKIHFVKFHFDKADFAPLFYVVNISFRTQIRLADDSP